MSRPKLLFAFLAVAAIIVLIRCGTANPNNPLAPVVPFRILAGSGHTTFEPILKEFGAANGVDIQMTYKGSLDIMYLLEEGAEGYDAIWDGDSLWTSMGDKHKLIQNRESIMRSPVVFGLKKSIAQRLGWTTPGKELSVQDILDALEKENLNVMMTSATQSNSGASAYFGFLYAFAKPDDILTSQDLQDPHVQAQLKKILATIDRTSESSGWLINLFELQHARYDGMFNYESHIIELNQRLVKKNLEPLYMVYPTPGLGIADFPLSYLDRGDESKKKIFADLQAYLLSGPVRRKLMSFGRRVDVPGGLDANIFKPEWGVDTARVISPTRLPATEVILNALNLYQAVLRKPSFTVYVLDYSGSMRVKGEQQRGAAMELLLDQNQASKYLLQASPDDVSVVIPFDDHIYFTEQVNGNDPAKLGALIKLLHFPSVGASTNFYTPVAHALEVIKAQGIGNRLPAIILMTDGKANSGSIQEVQNAIASTGLKDVPVYGITFGDADPAQLQKLADLTGGRVFDGTKDLIAAFRRAKGNN